jgi:hypothetical protein
MSNGSWVLTLIKALTTAGKTGAVPSKANRRKSKKFDHQMYGARYLIWNFWPEVKQFRAIAPRYDKMARNFLAAIRLAASVDLAKLATRHGSLIR